MFVNRCLLVLALIFATYAYAEDEIYTINLKHRLAADILPEIKAFIPNEATIRAYGNTLILKSDRATLANVEMLLETLDKAQQSIIINVLRASEAIQNQDGSSTHIRVEADDEISGSMRVERWTTKDKADQNQQFRAVGISGKPIAISFGKDIPHQQQILITGPLSIGLANDTDYVSVNSGFQAVAHLLPEERVKVEILPYFSRQSNVNDDIHRSQIITTLTGKTNQWLELGRTVENSQLSQQGTHVYSTNSNQQQIIYLKVNIQN